MISRKRVMQELEEIRRTSKKWEYRRKLKNFYQEIIIDNYSKTSVPVFIKEVKKVFNIDLSDK